MQFIHLISCELRLLLAFILPPALHFKLCATILLIWRENCFMTYNEQKYF